MPARINAILDKFEAEIEAIADAADPAYSFARAEGDAPLDTIAFATPDEAHRRYQISLGGLSPRRPEIQGAALIQERVRISIMYAVRGLHTDDAYRELERDAAGDYARLVRALVWPATPWQTSTSLRILDPISRPRLRRLVDSRAILDLEFEILYAQD
jgi:hypothetical protein